MLLPCAPPGRCTMEPLVPFVNTQLDCSKEASCSTAKGSAPGGLSHGKRPGTAGRRAGSSHLHLQPASMEPLGGQVKGLTRKGGVYEHGMHMRISLLVRQPLPWVALVGAWATDVWQHAQSLAFGHSCTEGHFLSSLWHLGLGWPLTWRA